MVPPPPPTTTTTTIVVANLKNDSVEQDSAIKRFLQCPGMCRVDVLKKFVRNKYNVDTNRFYVSFFSYSPNCISSSINIPPCRLIFCIRKCHCPTITPSSI